MGMLSDFLTLIKGTQTNISGVFVGKNGKITSTAVDSTPTASSQNLVTSGGVKSAIDSSVEYRMRFSGSQSIKFGEIAKVSNNRVTIILSPNADGSAGNGAMRFDFNGTTAKFQYYNNEWVDIKSW